MNIMEIEFQLSIALVMIFFSLIQNFEPKITFCSSYCELSVLYTQCTVKLRPNFQKIAQLKCTTNEKRNLSEHDEKNFKSKIFS